MSEKTAIAWTDHTFNIAWGCTKVSPGCTNCYADTLATRYGFSVWGPRGSRRVFSDKHWREPEKWNREAQAEGRRHRVFCSSMCDNFEDHPTIVAQLERLWELIRNTPWLDWQLLTKRADRIDLSLPADWGDEGYHNVWLGVSAENHEYAAQRLQHLAQIPAVVRFVSYEPALGPIDWHAPVGFNGHRLIDVPDWIIYGGESGPGYRGHDLAWPRATREACEQNGVAFFYKQSPAHRTELGIELDGEIVRNYSTPRATMVGRAEF